MDVDLASGECDEHVLAIITELKAANWMNSHCDRFSYGDESSRVKNLNFSVF